MAKAIVWNYNLYKAIMFLSHPDGANMSAKKIAITLDMSYGLVRRYLMLDESSVEKIKGGSE